jgi:hypothetical protein
LEELLREALNVYEEKQNTQEKNTFQRVGLKPAQKSQKGRPNSCGSGGKKKNRCFQCGKPGHFKQECPEGRKEEKIVPLMAFEEELGIRGSFMWMVPTRGP